MNFEKDLIEQQKFEQQAKREYAIAGFFELHPELDLEANRNVLREYLGDSLDIEQAVRFLGDRLARKRPDIVQEESEQRAAQELEARRQAVIDENKRRLAMSPLELRKLIKAGVR